MKALLLLLVTLGGAWASFQTVANFTSNFAAYFEIFDDDVYGPDSLMKATLIYDGLPIELEENGGMWLGIGFSATSMLNADIVICQWNDTNGKTSCSDRKANSTYLPNGPPPNDVIDNVWTVSGYKADNRLQMTFKRYLNTQDYA